MVGLLPSTVTNIVTNYHGIVTMALLLHLLASDTRTHGFHLLTTNYGLSLSYCHTRAPSWILRKTENLASLSLQDGATKWYYNH